MSSSDDDIRKRAEVDRLLSAANAYRIKGDLLAGEDECRKALEVDADNVRAAEMLGDFLHARGKLDDALAAYRALLEADESLAAVERKYATVALEIGERNRQRHAVEEALAAPENKAEAKRGAGIAILLSFVAPGVGQMYNGEIMKGAIILGSFILSLLVIAVAPGTGAFIKGTFYTITGYQNPENPGGGIVWPSAWLLFFVGVGLFAFIYAVVDAPVFAIRRSREEDDERRQA